MSASASSALVSVSCLLGVLVSGIARADSAAPGGADTTGAHPPTPAAAAVTVGEHIVAPGMQGGPDAADVPLERSYGFVKSGGEDIYYESTGHGDPLVLCHGAAGNHLVWYQQVAALAASYRVITWDQRGFGLSTNKTGVGGPEAAVRDLEAVLTHLEVRRAHLVGQSMGGWAALGLVLAHPDRVLSLILADSVAGIETPEIEAAEDAYLKAARAAPRPETLPLGRHPALKDDFWHRDPARAFLYQDLSLLRQPEATGGQAQRNTTYARDSLRRIKTPVLFVVGSQDEIFPPALIRRAAALVPGATVVEIPDAGHSPYFETPDVWNAAVLSFLQQDGGHREPSGSRGP